MHCSNIKCFSVGRASNWRDPYNLDLRGGLKRLSLGLRTSLLGKRGRKAASTNIKKRHQCQYEGQQHFILNVSVCEDEHVCTLDSVGCLKLCSLNPPALLLHCVQLAYPVLVLPSLRSAHVGRRRQRRQRRRASSRHSPFEVDLGWTHW